MPTAHIELVHGNLYAVIVCGERTGPLHVSQKSAVDWLRDYLCGPAQ